MITDVIGREIVVGDLVFYYGNIYQVLELKEDKTWWRSQIKVIMFNKSKTTRACFKNAYETCLLPKDDAMIWMLKGERHA